jgi:hypothetical protein
MERVDKIMKRLRKKNRSKILWMSSYLKLIVTEINYVKLKKKRKNKKMGLKVLGKKWRINYVFD